VLVCLSTCPYSLCAHKQGLHACAQSFYPNIILPAYLALDLSTLARRSTVLGHLRMKEPVPSISASNEASANGMLQETDLSVDRLSLQIEAP
jgi:hypothetical protein